MRRLSATLLAAAVLAALPLTTTPVAAQGAPGVVGSVPLIPVISVSGMGEAQVTPDRARLSLGVHTQALTAADASARNAQLQRAVIDAVRGLGVGADQITTNGYSVSPDQTYDPQGRRARITGYSVQNTVVVELRRIDQVGPVLDAVLAKGANVVSSLQFYSSQAEATQRQAMQNAITRARADAEAMASAAGGRLGELIELTSGGGFRPQPMYEVSMAAARSSAPAATPISEGTQTLTAVVTARWRFLAGPPAGR